MEKEGYHHTTPHRVHRPDPSPSMDICSNGGLGTLNLPSWLGWVAGWVGWVGPIRALEEIKIDPKLGCLLLGPREEGREKKKKKGGKTERGFASWPSQLPKLLFPASWLPCGTS